MIVNNRAIGKASGWFTGIEVEHTQFVGMDTLFIMNAHAMHEFDWLDLEVKNKPHVFLAPILEAFGIGDMKIWDSIFIFASRMMSAGKCVTLEIAPEDILRQEITSLRFMYPAQFCALLVVEVPLTGIGAFAIKAAPSHVFENLLNEDGVHTITFERMKKTRWEEYDGDVDGKV